MQQKTDFDFDVKKGSAWSDILHVLLFAVFGYFVLWVLMGFAAVMP